MNKNFKVRLLNEKLDTLNSQMLRTKKIAQMSVMFVFVFHILLDFFAAVEFVVESRKPILASKKEFLYIMFHYDLVWYIILTVNGILGGPRMNLTRLMFGVIQIYFIWHFWQIWKRLVWQYKVLVLLRIGTYILVQNVFCTVVYYWQTCALKEQEQTLTALQKLPRLKIVKEKTIVSEKSFFDWLTRKIEKAIKES